MGLKARMWDGNTRNVEAASVPFRSMQIATDFNPSVANTNLEFALKRIEDRSSNLPPRFLPRPFGPDGPPGAQWGPFVFPDDVSGFYSGLMDQAVRLFQRQAGLVSDGKAGIQTFARLDEILVAIEGLP